jgi:hypothetical protein
MPGVANRSPLSDHSGEIPHAGQRVQVILAELSSAGVPLPLGRPSVSVRACGFRLRGFVRGVRSLLPMICLNASYC